MYNKTIPADFSISSYKVDYGFKTVIVELIFQLYYKSFKGSGFKIAWFCHSAIC